MSELRHGSGALIRRAGTPGLGVLAFVVLVWIASGGAPSLSAAGTPSRSVAESLVSGMFVAGAACAAVVGWRRHAPSGHGWTSALGALIAVQALLVTLPAVAHPAPRPTLDLAAMLVVGSLGLVLVLAALAGLRQAPHIADDSFVVGLGMGLMAAGHLILLVPVGSPVAVPMQVLIGLLAGTQVTAAVVVLSRGVLSRSTAELVLATALVVGVRLVLMGTDLRGKEWDLALMLALAAVGAAWVAATWGWIQSRPAREADLAAQIVVDLGAMDCLAEIDETLLATTRDQRERLHELRSTVAGLVHGSAMLDCTDLTDETRQRLWESLRRELHRMQRLLSQQHQVVTPLDLDEALSLILDLQRLKGRHVELHCSGAAVQARYDSLAEVVNILMDNAATHGGSDSSLVEVVCRDEDTVDITVSDNGRGIPAEQRERIFDWGIRGEDSPGEGIGLHVAQRLMAEDGGSLRLAEATGTGSAFVISLPAVRRSTENDLSEEDDHVAWRRSG